MTAPQESLRTLLQDWANQETQEQSTPLTPALLRCKLRLFQADARRERARRVQMALFIPAVLLGLWAAVILGNPGALLQNLWALTPSALGSVLAFFGLAALVGPGLASE